MDSRHRRRNPHRHRSGTGADHHQTLDVTDPVSFRRYLSAVEQQLGPLEMLVNNAGIMPTGALLEESDALTRRILEINTFGTMIGTKAALSLTDSGPGAGSGGALRRRRPLGSSRRRQRRPPRHRAALRAQLRSPRREHDSRCRRPVRCRRAGRQRRPLEPAAWASASICGS
ncbi:SDR family NAD(P)-dependent oxidoreductase [Nocardia uniformis]|uniref:SDR family NAD(P)-dependent oxidoreductase n=1 Tax=Nocardia uniformis TaxID=53432 RepID=UPI00353079A6